MIRSFTAKINSIVSIKYKYKYNKHNKHIQNKNLRNIFPVKEDYTYSKNTIDKINKQTKHTTQNTIHNYWRYHHGDEL